jgi:hypothetical protein
MTTQTGAARGLWWLAVGLALGLVAYTVLRPTDPVGGTVPDHFRDLLPGGLLLFSGIWQLFYQAAFPDRFQDTDRVGRAVTSAATSMVGCALLIPGFTIALGVPAIAAMILARLGFPKRIFNSTS